MAITRKRDEPTRPDEIEPEEESSRVNELAEPRPEIASEEGEARADVSADAALSPAEKKEFAKLGDEIEEEEEGDAGPVQLGHRRFVYAAYFAGAIAVAFFCSKAMDGGWTRLGLWKPAFGEPHDEIVMPVSAVIGGLTALYFWRDNKTRSLAEEVAEELAKVTWPNKQEVTNGTAVVIVTTLFATIFFALMDRFWGFVTNLVYGS
ncbi:MAG: preprotein translocase subunit SecE [Polyangiaceae bacterium]